MPIAHVIHPIQARRMTQPRPLGSSFHSPLRLYITGETPGALRALESRRQLLKALGGTVEIEIIDIVASPAKAEAAGILATPTLSDDYSKPPRRMIGDFGDIDRVLQFFGFRTREKST
jgi:circadian clock protein KaiB